MLIVWDEALAVLSGHNRGSVSLQIVDVSPVIFWDQFLVSTLGLSLWNIVFADFPGIVILLLSMVSS